MILANIFAACLGNLAPLITNLESRTTLHLLRPHPRQQLLRGLSDPVLHFPLENPNKPLPYQKKLGVQAQAIERLDWRLSSGLALWYFFFSVNGQLLADFAFLFFPLFFLFFPFFFWILQNAVSPFRFSLRFFMSGGYFFLCWDS